MFRHVIRIAAVAAALAASVLPAAAQSSISFRAGESLISTGERNRVNLFGRKYASSTVVDMKLAWQDRSGSVFDSMYGHPEFGIGLGVDCLGQNSFTTGSFLSNMYNVYGFFDRPVLTTERLMFQYSLALGVGYTSSPYHPVTNPGNMIIGSRVTAHLVVGLELFYRLAGGSDAGLGVYFYHNSCGTSHLPNDGLNGIEAALTLRHRLQTGAGRDRTKPIVSTGGAEVSKEDFRRHFCYDIYFGAGANVLGSEFKLYNTDVEDPAEKQYRLPARARFSFGGAVLYRYCRRAASGIGIDAYCSSYTKMLYELDCRLYPDREIDPYRPFSVGITAQQEFYYRNVGFRFAYGAYLFKKDGEATSYRCFQNIGLRYYIPRAANLFVALGLKSHRFSRAEHIQFIVGKRF